MEMSKRIVVEGSALLRVQYSVVLNMSEEEWDALSDSKANSMIEHHVDWLEAGRNAQVWDIDIDDVIEKEA